MRRRVPAVVLVVLTALALSACGSSSSGTSPFKTELSYFPAGSVFVMTVATAPNGAAAKQGQALMRRIPLAGFGLSAATAKLAQLGIDYQSDLGPLFGNPIVLGIASPSFSGARQKLLAVWETKDATKLSELVKRLLGSAPTSTHDGATLYSLGTTTLAVSGATALFSGSASTITAALDRHARGGGFTGAEYESQTAGLPSNPIIEIFGNLATALSTPGTAKARRVPWVAALRGYGAAVTANSTGVGVQFHLDTTGGTLTADQLPFATGSTPPHFAGMRPITGAVHNASQIVAFAESVEQATNPREYAKFQARQATVRRRTGADLNTLAGLLTGDLIVSSDTHVTIGRAAVSSGAAASRTLSKLMTAPRSVFKNATHVTKLPRGFYAIREGKHTITLGVVGREIVAGNASPRQLRSFAVAPATPATWAHGAVAFRVALPTLLHLVMKQPPSQIIQIVLASLGDITGWASASPGGINGTATLAVR